MEKFAVDLEKVLNEFEFNEERRESGPTSSVRTLHSPHDGIGVLRQPPPPLPSAAIYRKPSFERINLADANFAASPPKSSSLGLHHGLYDRENENVGAFSYLNKPQILNNRNYVQVSDALESALNNDVNINKQIIIETEDSSPSKIWQKPTAPVHSEEKPDLLEYNSKTADSDLNNLEIHNQLPDITTSVRASSLGVNNNAVDNLSNSLDLISSANGTLLTEANEAVITQESDLTSNYPTFNEKKLVEDINGSFPSLMNELSGVLPSSDYGTVQESSELESKTNCDETSQLDSYSVPRRDENCISNNKEGCLTSSEDTLDLNESTGLDVNQLKIKSDLSKPLNEHEVLKLPEDRTKGCSNKSDRLSQNLNVKKVIGFNNDEDYSQSQLLEYLERVDKESEETNSEEVVLSEQLPKLPNESNVKIDNTDCRMKINNESHDASIKTINNKERIFDLSNIKLLPVNSLQSISVHGEELSANSSSQNVHDNALKFQPNYIPQGMDCKINLETNYVVEKESSEKDSTIAPDHKNDVEKSVKQHQNPVVVKNLDDSLISSGQAVEDISKNPFDLFIGDANIAKLELKSRSTNPFENDSENTFDDDTGNPFESDTGISSENDTKNPFEGSPEVLHDVESVLEVTSQPVLQKHIQNIASIESSSENVVSNNDSAFGKSSICEVASTSSESLSRSNANTVAETVENVFDLPQKLNSSSSEVGAISNKNADFEINKAERVNFSEENPSTDCSPSSSSLDSESFNSSLIGSAKMIPIKQAIESPSVDMHSVDEAGIPAEEDRPVRPNSLELPQRITVESNTSHMNETGLERESVPEDRRLGKIAPFWIPDTDTTMCMQCQLKFNVIRRRHHCRACGQVLCNKCCGLKARLEYMDFEEARVCQPCFTILEAVSASESTSPQRRRPNPNNPMEYCSTIPPLQQAAGSMHKPPPSVMVPVGVLKREGRSKSEVTKQVMFSDGIRPGGDLTELDGSTEPRIPFRRSGRLTKRVGTPPGSMMSPSMRRVMDTATHSFIPAEGDNALPPVVTCHQGEVSYVDLESPIDLNQPVVKFALNRNLFVSVKKVLLDCCVNRECWCFCSSGLACVGQDEIVFLLECLPQEMLPPKDVFLLINFLYQDAAKGSTVSEMSFTPATSNSLLGSRDHGGFLYIRTSYQCTAQLVLPSPPYLIALLIHRWETPWARLFPMRLMLRLGAEFRYYPCPLVSVRNRPPLYTDIGHTIINILADFRKYSYTLPSVRGLVIHMEDRQTTINIPRNRYDQVVRALNNSNDSVLAFGANLSLAADSHLVCMQSTEDENTSYHTQAINIHNKPRKVTGASFVVFNGALKVPGLAGKSNIVEDGLMVQVPSETMTALRSALRDMRDYSIGCGPNAEETVLLQWTTDDTNFNIGVKSCIDGKPLDGIPSIRVHNGTDYSGGLRLIRWTEVFILQCEDSEHSNEPLDISRLSESIARATCLALIPLLDLLSAASLTTLAVRTTIHPDNVGYEAGSNGEKLPPLYMKSLDDELVAVVHQAALISQENPAILELVFRIMEQG